MPLIDELNTVLVHNAEVVGLARTHAGNLAHTLKTPLSGLPMLPMARTPHLPS